MSPMIRRALTVNHVLITLFGCMTGVYKILGGEADVALFANIGMSELVVRVFGAVQLAFALALLHPKSRPPGAIGLAICNAVATLGLFVGAVIPFGVISMAFIAMALLELVPRGVRDPMSEPSA